MSTHNKKQFGIWMDTQHAVVVGRDGSGNEDFVVLGHVKREGAGGNSNENAGNNHANALAQKFFKEAAAVMRNVDEVHVTGTGQVQEQFIHFLAETPQFKNAAATESTSNKMSDAQLLSFVTEHYQ